MSYLDKLLGCLEGVQHAPDGWTARCPAVTHGGEDEHPSLRVTVGDGGRLLVRCRTGCSTKIVLDALNLGFRDLWPGEGDAPAEPMALPAEEPTEEELALRDRVYRDLLKLLKLDEQHRQSLMRRGLTRSQTSIGGYRTLPHDQDVSALDRLYGDQLYSVPGFRPGPRLVLSERGILIPCRDAKHRINALKLRRDGNDSPRYLYLSGGEASCGLVLHHPAIEAKHQDYWRITEGELKADVATSRTGRFTLGIPGVGAIGRLLPWLAQQGDTGKIPPLRLALDWPDVVQKRPVFQALDDAVRLLQEAGHEVGVEIWNAHLDQKGIDDLLQAGHNPDLLEGQPLADELRRLQQSFLPSPAELRKPSVLGGDPEPFPLDCLPAGLDEYVAAVSTSRSCPPDFAAVALLTIASAAAGCTRRLNVTDDWKEYPCLYSCIVAPPSSRKSPAMKALLAPVYRRQAESFKQSEESGDPVTHYFTSDATTEGMVAILKKTPRGLLMMRDELVSWVLSDNQYRQGKGADRQFWLPLWSSEPVKKDRQSADSYFLARPFLSILGGTQPDMLSEFTDRKGRQDGFLQRLLMVYPAWDVRVPFRRPPMDPTVSELWSQTVERLYALDFEDGEPVTLSFTPDASNRYEAWYEGHEDELRGKDFPRQLVTLWPKMTAYCARLSLLVRLLATSDPEGRENVTDDDVEKGVRLVEYFKSHAKRVYGLLHSQPQDADVHKLVEYARAAPSGQITVREAMRKLSLPTRTATMEVIKRACDLDLGEQQQVQLARQKTPGFLAYPEGER